MFGKVAGIGFPLPSVYIVPRAFERLVSEIETLDDIIMNKMTKIDKTKGKEQHRNIRC